MIAEGLIIKLISSLIVGGLIGFEREYRDKAAGFRTIILIVTGSMLFSHFSTDIGGDYDPVRIAASVVTGVGFLGAGAILVDKGRIQGLTTASTIWLSAALGVGLGAGLYSVVYPATAVILVVLWLLPLFERSLDNDFTHLMYKVIVHRSYNAYELLDKLHTDNKLNVSNIKRSRKGDEVTISWEARGHSSLHDQVIQELIANDSVIEFSAS